MATTNSRQIFTANSYGEFSRQITTANSCGKLSRQIPTANSQICNTEDGVEYPLHGRALRMKIKNK